MVVRPFPPIGRCSTKLPSRTQVGSWHGAGDWEAFLGAGVGASPGAEVGFSSLCEGPWVAVEPDAEVAGSSCCGLPDAVGVGCEPATPVKKLQLAEMRARALMQARTVVMKFRLLFIVPHFI